MVFSFKLRWYISSLFKQFPSREQVSFCQQLHLGWTWVSPTDRILLLCDFIMLSRLGKQLRLTLTYNHIIFLCLTFFEGGKC